MIESVMLASLRRFLPADQRDEILGDLCEERQRRVDTGRDWRLWMAGQVAALVAYALLVRPLRRGTSRRDRPGGAKGRDPWERWSQAAVQAVRSLARRPGYASVVAGTLALGIGATTALFSIVHAAILQPLPFPDPDRLVRIGERGEGAGPGAIWSMSVANFLDLDAKAETFQELAAYSATALNLSGPDLPECVRGLRVTHDFLATVGIPVALGRGFIPEDDVEGAEPVVILSQGLWQRLFGADPAAVGGLLHLDGESYRIIGVAGGDFLFDTQVWLPFAWTGSERANRRGRSIEGVARLKAGVALDAGMAELSGNFAGLATAYPEVNGGRSVGGRGLQEWYSGPNTARRLLLFSGASLLVLLIATANAVNLGLARAEGRRRELAVRAALGCGRLRLVGLLVAESVALALVGGVLGVLLAYVGSELLVSRLGHWIPRATDVSINGAVLGFALAVAIFAGAVVGLVPAMRLPMENLRAGIGNIRSDGATSRSMIRRALVVVEVSLSLILLVGAGVLTQSVWRLGQVDMGFDGNGVATFALSLPHTRYGEPESALGFLDAALDEIQRIPGVVAAGGQNRDILSMGGNGNVVVEGETGGGYQGLVEMREVTQRFFEALGIGLQAGRHFERRDRDVGGVAIVNESFVRDVLKGAGAVGTRFGPQGSSDSYTIVGVVGDIRQSGPDRNPAPTAYYPFGRGPWGFRPYMVAVVRVQGDPLALVPTMRRRLAALDPDVPLADVASLETAMEESVGGPRMTAAILFRLFAAVALLLGACGVYSVMAFDVSQRRQEMGVRRALGAPKEALVWQVVGRGLAVACVGLIVGLAGTAVLGRTLSGLLYEVGPADPLTLLAVTGTLSGVAFLACYVPARRAANVDPMDTLREG